MMKFFLYVTNTRRTEKVESCCLWGMEISHNEGQDQKSMFFMLNSVILFIFKLCTCINWTEIKHCLFQISV